MLYFHWKTGESNTEPVVRYGFKFVFNTVGSSFLIVAQLWHRNTRNISRFIIKESKIVCTMKGLY